VQSAYDLALEMCFQKGDPGAPRLTNWELPWRKFGGDKPTTTYLSAPVAASFRYRLRGHVRGAVYAGVQVYTRGPGYNARRPTSPTYGWSTPTARSTYSSAVRIPGTAPRGCRCCLTTIW
jgi:hypothetical protein